MNIDIEYFAQIRKITGVDNETVVLEEGCDLLDLLKKLSRHHKEHFSTMVFEDEYMPRASVLYTRNDEQVLPEQGVTLRDRDRVMIMTPMSGG